jgi:hypothetical protein
VLALGESRDRHVDRGLATKRRMYRRNVWNPLRGRPACTAGRRRPANVTSMDMPRHWIVLQVLIVIFVLAGAVIAITKLA